MKIEKNIEVELRSLIDEKQFVTLNDFLMKNGKDLPEFDHSKEKDTLYCVEWGIAKGEWITDGIIDRYIEELNGL